MREDTSWDIPGVLAQLDEMMNENTAPLKETTAADKFVAAAATVAETCKPIDRIYGQCAILRERRFNAFTTDLCEERRIIASRKISAITTSF